MTNIELAQSIRHGLFANRETVKEAWDYAFEVINSLRESDRLAATTAMMVLLNTISNQILENEAAEDNDHDYYNKLDDEQYGDEDKGKV